MTFDTRPVDQTLVGQVIIVTLSGEPLVPVMVTEVTSWYQQTAGADRLQDGPVATRLRARTSDGHIHTFELGPNDTAVIAGDEAAEHFKAELARNRDRQRPTVFSSVLPLGVIGLAAMLFFFFGLGPHGVSFSALYIAIFLSTLVVGGAHFFILRLGFRSRWSWVEDSFVHTQPVPKSP
ncbi:hypothetical protein ACFVAJ_17655 [Agromyces sp. NPDC057679]|uniref:hypothetical protein n=1 Tax=Agromyces sp. NPDC057679 TaxID=3346207 RepID=UPI003670A64F